MQKTYSKFLRKKSTYYAAKSWSRQPRAKPTTKPPSKTKGRVLRDEPIRQLRSTETGIFGLQVRSCGIAFQLICDKLTLAFNDLNGY